MNQKLNIRLITANEGKAREFKNMLGDFANLETEAIELNEIQSLDSQEVARFKLEEAVSACSNTKFDYLMIDDTSLEISSLNGLPGPFSKWFLQKLGPDGIYKIAPESEALAICMLSLWDKEAEKPVHLLGEVEGKIVRPRGNLGFGWDSIFEPDGQEKTFAEMTTRDKNIFGHRAKAVNSLKKFFLV